jgi:predicted phage tail protein
MIHVIVVKNPFDVRQKEDYYDPYIVGQPVSGYHHPEESEHYSYSINGLPALPDALPQDGDEIVVMPYVGKKALGWVLTIGIAVVSGGIGAGLIGGMTSVWARIGVSMLVSAIGGVLVNKLTATPKVDTTNTEQSNTYGWGGVQSLTGQGYVLPVIYGKMKTAGIILQRHVYSDGEKQYLNLLIAVAEGPIDSISDIKIDGNPVENYEDVEVETRLGTNDQAIISNFGDSYADTALGYELNYKDGEESTWSHWQLDGNAAQGIEITLSFPNGLYYSDDKGNPSDTWVQLQAQFRKVGDADWYDLPIQNETNGQRTKRVLVPLLGYIYVFDKDADKQYDGLIHASTSTAFYRVYRYYDLDPGQYEVRVRCIGKAGTSIRYANKVQWQGVTQVIYDDFIHPGKALIGIKALATDQLSGSDPTITCLVERKHVRIWNPTTMEYEDQPANNPAWASYDILHHCQVVDKLGTYPSPTFTRASTAYDNDGNKVAVNVPRFTDEGLMIEEGVTNYIQSVQNTYQNMDIYNPGSATYTVSTTPDSDGYYTITITGATLNYIRFNKSGIASATYYGYITAYVVSGTAFVGSTGAEKLITTTPTRFAINGRTSSDAYLGFYNITSGTVIKAKNAMITTLPYDVSYIDAGATRAEEMLYNSAFIHNPVEGEIQFNWTNLWNTPANYMNQLPQKSQTLIHVGAAYYGLNSFGLYRTGGNNNALSFLGRSSVSTGGWGLNKGVTVSGIDAVGVKHRIAIAWHDSRYLCLSVDGTEVLKDADIGSGTLTALTKIVFAQQNGGVVNAKYSDIRVSNTFHSAERRASDAQLGRLQVEDDTTYYLPLTEDIQPDMIMDVPDGVDRGNMDYYAFDAWAERCAAENIEFNYLYDTAMRTWDALAYPSRVGNGAILMMGAKFTCTYDYASDPVQLLTVGNIKKDSFKEEFQDTYNRANSLEISFLNADKDYDRDILPVYGDNYDSSDTVTDPTQIELMGCTSRQQAWLYGRRKLRANQYEIRALEVGAFADAIACRIGDVITIQSDVTLWGAGGRIKAVNGNAVTLDQELTESYDKIRVRDSATDKLYDTVITNTNKDTVYVSDATGISADAVYALYKQGKKPKDIRVLSIERSLDDQTRIIRGVEYYPELYEIDTSVVPDIESPDMSVPAPSNLHLSAATYKEKDGTITSVINCTWDIPRRQLYTLHVWARPEGEAWQEAIVLTAGEVQATIANVRTLCNYDVKIYCTDDLGRKSEEVSGTVYVSGKDLPPSDVASLTAVQDPILPNVLHLSWPEVKDADLKGYILYDASYTAMTDVIYGSQIAMQIDKSGTYQYRIRAVDRSGNVSDNYASTPVMTVAVEPDNVLQFSATKNGYNYILTWHAVSNSGASYEIRDGMDYDRGVLVARDISGTSKVYTPSSEGIVRLGIKAVNSAGLYSRDAAYITINVSALAPKNVILSYDDLTSQGGTRANTVFAQSYYTCLTLPGACSDYPDLRCNDFGQTVLTLSDGGAEGTYEVHHDMGAILTGNLTINHTSNMRLESDVTVGIEYCLSVDDVNYSAWQAYGPTEISARYINVRVTLSTTDATRLPELLALTVSLDVDDKTVTGAVSLPAGGAWVSYGYTYHQTPAGVAQALGDGVAAQVTQIELTRAYIKVQTVGSSPADTAGTVSYIFTGF